LISDEAAEQTGDDASDPRKPSFEAHALRPAKQLTGAGKEQERAEANRQPRVARPSL
jgi:hypothetical protein